MNSSEGNSSGIPVQVKKRATGSLFQMQSGVWIHQFHQEWAATRFGSMSSRFS